VERDSAGQAQIFARRAPSVGDDGAQMPDDVSQ
jgi:hypothetical protein